MNYSVGDIVEGTVTKISKFNATIGLPDGKHGQVRISEIAVTYVKDIRHHLKENQKIKAKVLGIGQDGHLDLSIKKTLSDQEPVQKNKQEKNAVPESKNQPQSSLGLPVPFEERLNRIARNSETKLDELKKNIQG